MFLAFGFAGSSITRYAIFTALCGSIFGVLVPLQVALSIYLHQKGVRWSFAHYPIYALLHFGGVIALMGIAKRTILRHREAAGQSALP